MFLSGDEDEKNIPYSFPFLLRDIDDIFILSLHVSVYRPSLHVQNNTYYFQTTRIYMRVSTDSTVHWLLEKVAIQFLHGYYRPKGTVKSKGGDRRPERGDVACSPRSN